MLRFLSKVGLKVEIRPRYFNRKGFYLTFDPDRRQPPSTGRSGPQGHYSYLTINVFRMKKVLQALLQRLLGFDRYLFFFSQFKIMTLRWDGQNKEGDFNHFLTLLTPTDRVLDIGANLGIMTVLMARRCPKGKVYAFEPVQDNFRTLQKVVAAHGLSNVELFPIALGERQGHVQLTMPVLQGVRMQGLAHVDHQSIEGYEAEHINYQAELWPLDELPALQGEAIHAVKMDVENYEQFVLQGGRKLLQAHQPIIYCELWDNENRQHCFTLLRSIGYQIHVLENGQLTPFQPGIHPHHNFFFTPAS